MTESQRIALEQRFRLIGGHQTEGTTWAYELTDSSLTNIHAIVRDPAVDDTAHINRRFFRPAFAFDREARIAVDAVMFGAVVSLLLLAGANIPAATALVRVQPAVTLILGIAPAVILAVSVVILAMAAIGYQPLWANRSVTLAEASHAGDSATVLRMLNGGSDPNTAGPVMLDRRAEPVMLTPLEAAVESRQVETVRLLIRRGARTSEPDRQRLACLAVAVVAPEVAAYLQSAIPPAAGPDCSTLALPAH